MKSVTSELIVITYPSPDDAQRVADTIRRLEAERLLEIEDLEYCVRDLEGDIALYESINRPLAGAALGAFWGTFLGKCFGNPLLGAGIGAAGGALVSRLGGRDGIDETFVRNLSATLAPGSSAIFVLVRRYTAGKVLPRLGGFGGTVLHTSLSDEDEERLQNALDEAHRKSAGLSTEPVPRARLRHRRVVHRG
jgi:uncharacterized membrane protein